MFATTAGYAATLDFSWVNAAGSTGSSAEIPLLPVGATTLTIAVTAQDRTRKEYVVTMAKSRGRLADLVISDGTFNFSSATTSYTVRVSNLVTSLRVTATAIIDDTMIRITDPAGDGSTTASDEVATTIGLPGGLSLGDNNVEIEAIGSDGTRNTYRVNVVRARGNARNIATMSASPWTLTPLFATERFGEGNVYTVRVPNSATNVILMTTQMSVSGNHNSRRFYDVTGGGQTFLGGRHAGSSPPRLDQRVPASGNLRVGVTNLRIDNNWPGNPRSYYVNIIRAASADANLSALSISTGTGTLMLTPAFSSMTTAYRVAFDDSSVRSLTVAATATDAAATVVIEPSEMVDLAPGATVITATVTAQDGITRKAYVITVTRPVSNDATLSDLSVSGDGVSHQFALAGGTTQHEVEVLPRTGVVTVTAVASADDGASVAITPSDADDNVPGHQVNLEAGDDTVINITVTAEDGTTQAYRITAQRPSSSNADLRSLRVSATGVGVLDIGTFDAGTTAYDLIVKPLSVDEVTVFATAAGYLATLAFSWENAAGSTGSGAEISLLPVGATTLTIAVTAQDGTTQAYTVTMAKSRGRLADLMISAGNLNFGSATTRYTVNVANRVTRLQVTATAIAGNTRVRITGPRDADSVTALGEVVTTIGPPDGLSRGLNEVSIAAIGSDGTSNTYIVNIMRGNSPPGLLATMIARPGRLVPSFSTDWYGTENRYTLNVPSSARRVEFRTRQRARSAAQKLLRERNRNYNPLVISDVTEKTPYRSPRQAMLNTTGRLRFYRRRQRRSCK